MKTKKKKSLSGLLIIFRPVISNILLSYVKFSCALGNKWDLTDRHSHAKGDAEMCCGAVQT